MAPKGRAMNQLPVGPSSRAQPILDEDAMRELAAQADDR
jgi:hypothetical protein